MSDKIKIVECPRDAMQGLKDFISTEDKARYINQLLKVGYDTIDFGSFVSPKAIPQMRDTADVLSRLHLDQTDTELLAIIANRRGAEDACHFDEIKYLGFPFSVSETFQRRNTNASVEESYERVERIFNISQKHDKKFVVYISMGFGNPYGDPWNVEIIQKSVERLSKIGVEILSLSDTIGVAQPNSIAYLFKNLIPSFPEIEFGAHLHTKPQEWEEKVDTAFKNGCKRFDSAIFGFGGCPMAKDDLTGNMPTENLLHYFNKTKEADLVYDKNAFFEAQQIAKEIFPH